MIGISMLGLGAGGVFIAISPRLRSLPVARLIPWCGLAAGIAVALGYLLVAAMPLNLFELVVRVTEGQVVGVAWETGKLVVICVALLVPFLLGPSLQANLKITANAADHALLAALGDDLPFVTITSAVALAEGAELAVQVTPSSAQKCERCWHWRDDVGHDSAHPTICGRCTSNLFGAGEARKVA